MRTRTLHLFASAVLLSTSALGAGGQIEMTTHRFSRTPAKHTERLVLEFKNLSGNGLPEVRVGADTGAGEVTIRVSDVSVQGTIPESAINDRFVPKSKLLGPIAINQENSNGFTMRTFLKDPDAKVDAFWLDNPIRLVVDAFGRGVSKAAARKVARTVAAARQANPGYICFPAAASVAMKVSFQGSSRSAGDITVPLDAGKGTGDAAEDAVVCYPRRSEVAAKISFEQAQEESPVASNDFGFNSSSRRPTAPANSVLRKSPSLSLDRLPLPSTSSKPSLLPPPALPQSQAPMMSLSLPSSTTPAAPARAPSAATDGAKPSLSLPLSLPALPQGAASADSGPPKLSLTPQAPAGGAPAPSTAEPPPSLFPQLQLSK